MGLGYPVHNPSNIAREPGTTRSGPSAAAPTSHRREGWGFQASVSQAMEDGTHLQWPQRRGPHQHRRDLTGALVGIPSRKGGQQVGHAKVRHHGV
jgi:hypothetical protein